MGIYLKSIRLFSANAEIVDKAEKSGSRSKQQGSKPSSRDPSHVNKTGPYYSIPHLEPKKLNDDVKAKKASNFKNKFGDWLNDSYPQGFFSQILCPSYGQS